jgi:DNA polymerase III epsilon subunit-like protein
MKAIPQPINEGSHAAGVGRFKYTIDPRPTDLGGGWRLKLLENDEEVGGGVFPVTPEASIDDAFADAWYEGEGWLGSRPAQIETEGAKQLQDAMIDIETLGRKPGAAVLSIGAVVFGATGLGESFYSPVLLQSCIDVGLTIDPETVAWWMKQSDEAREAAFRADAPPLPVVLLRFTEWFVAQQVRCPWCHGATFDVPILDAAYEACRLPAPWKFYDVRDTRTLYDLVGVKVDRSNGTHHNALDDARAQAEAAAAAFRRLSRLEQLEGENKDLRDQLDAAYNSLDRTGEWVRELEAKNAATQQGSADWIEDVIRDVAELPDRDSPPGQSDMMLVSGNELREILSRRPQPKTDAEVA